MQIVRILRANLPTLTCFALAIAAYVGLYAVVLRGQAATVEIDLFNGIRVLRTVPIYRNVQVFSVDWTETFGHGFAPIHYLDTLVRPKQWPKDQVTALSPEEKEEIAREMAAEDEQYLLN